MRKTFHFEMRREQRGIRIGDAHLALKYGRLHGERYVLNRDRCKQLLRRMERQTDRNAPACGTLSPCPTPAERSALMKILDSGGLVVAVNKGRFITAFRPNSYGW